MQHLIRYAICQLNLLVASFFLGILMRQEMPTNHIDKLFLQIIRDVAHSVIYTKLAKKHIDYKKVYNEIIQEVFNLSIAKNIKIIWIRPIWPLIYLIKILKPFEFFSLIHFLIKIIEIPNGEDTSLKKVFQLAFNIGQFIGNTQWYTLCITICIVFYLRMQLRWYHTTKDNISNENYLRIYLHINAILDNLIL